MRTALFAACATLAASATESPSFEVEAAIRSCKIERGMIENRDPVYCTEVAVEWYGIHAGVEICADMTDANRRQWRYNEIAPSVGYTFAPVEWLELDAAYIFKQEADEHTHEIEASVRLPFAWATPYASANLDVGEIPGALYGVIGVEREFEIAESLTVAPFIGMGFGNRKRNAEDFGGTGDAARDIHAGLEAAWEFSPGWALVPSVTVGDQFTSTARADTMHHGFAYCAGITLRAQF